VGLRASGRIGGANERDVWRYESSAGERRVADGAVVEVAAGAMAVVGGCGWWFCVVDFRSAMPLARHLGDTKIGSTRN